MVVVQPGHRHGQVHLDPVRPPASPAAPGDQPGQGTRPRAAIPGRPGRPGGTAPGADHPGEPAGPYSERLAAGDRILLYTDGMTDGRGACGVPFGVTRLAGFVIRCTAAGLPAPETLRRLGQAIAGYQDGRLSDDATAVLFKWPRGGQQAP
jgi:hypothetical protein